MNLDCNVSHNNTNVYYKKRGENAKGTIVMLSTNRRFNLSLNNMGT